jgi:hypothetical protein
MTVTSLSVIVFMTFVCFEWACFKSILSVSVHVMRTIRRNVSVPEMVVNGMSLQCVCVAADTTGRICKRIS